MGVVVADRYRQPCVACASNMGVAHRLGGMYAGRLGAQRSGSEMYCTWQYGRCLGLWNAVSTLWPCLVVGRTLADVHVRGAERARLAI